MIENARASIAIAFSSVLAIALKINGPRVGKKACPRTKTFPSVSIPLAFWLSRIVTEAARKSMTHKNGKLRIVLTRNPEKYESEKIPEQLEFTNEKPQDLIKRLEEEHQEGYLVGGAHTNTEFFRENLITELWQTIEPKILGLGNGMVGEEITDISLELLSSEKLNNKGTLLLKYKVVI